jgi:hypothetical protein
VLDAKALIEKHRGKNVLIDTNLLVLYLVGLVNRQRIRNFKRTGDFSLDDFDLLVELIRWFGKLIATPHVLSQVSDLTDLKDEELTAVRTLFKRLIGQIDEQYDEVQGIVSDPIFDRLGSTDAAIAVAGARKILVLTTDLQLQVALQDRGLDALNFNHVRALAWRPSLTTPPPRDISALRR